MEYYLINEAETQQWLGKAGTPEMTITKELVAHLANVSQIRLDEEQLAFMAKELSQMVDQMEVLNTVDTEGIAPLVYLSPRVNVTRPDVVTESCRREILLANAPEATEEAFVVPKTVG